jgi:hypothetical protein
VKYLYLYLYEVRVLIQILKYLQLFLLFTDLNPFYHFKFQSFVNLENLEVNSC